MKRNSYIYKRHSCTYKGHSCTYKGHSCKLNILVVLTGVFTLIWLAACGKDEPVPAPEATGRTILVYMVANNTLGDAGADTQDLEEMAAAARNGAIGQDNHLLVFRAGADGTQTLFRINTDGSSTELVRYPGSQYAVTANFMAQVFSDARRLAPAASYGLIMWSHAMGWTQNGQVDNGPDAQVKTWGDDRGHTMNITTLSRVFRLYSWDIVYFDCCYMGSVEVAYELAPYLDLMVASASEVPLDGMPYEQNLPLLFKSVPDLEGAARNTFNYYNSMTGENRTCTIGVFNLKAMDALASATAPIYRMSQKTSTEDFANLPLSDNSRPLFYDLGVYLNGLVSANGIDPAMLDNWTKCYNEVVLYHKATPRLWNTIDLTDFTGMSTFIPRNQQEETLRGYNQLAWYRDVAINLYHK